MVLSKASFFHKKYLDMYTNQMLPSIRKYVNENRCNSYLSGSPFLENCLRLHYWVLCYYGAVRDWHV